jgi:outer membrane protein OmpA-like peptidoglycan-associated protein
MKAIFGSFAICGILLAQPPQAPNPAQRNVTEPAGAPVPLYRVTVVARTTKAINYNHRSGPTQIDFRGTALMPDARGEAKVESRQGVIKINANMQKLQPPSSFGSEYLTYVLWAITPEGRATNVGEVLLNGDKSSIDATTELQSFGLIVTAEPYFAVTQPSDVVVMENFTRRDTTGTIEEIDAKYELLARGQYTLNVNPADRQPIRMDKKVPLELYEARNAVQIARWAGADKYASETYQKALVGLQNAEGYLKGKGGKRPIGTVAREAVQMAEDARIITVKKIAEEQLATERRAAADREARAVAAKEAEELRRSQAEAAQRAEADQRAKAEADRARAEADRAAAQLDAQRTRQEAEAVQLAARAEADRLKRETEAQRTAAQADIERATKEKAEAEAARADAIAQQQAALAETEKAKLAAQESERLRQKAEAEKTELRAELLRQFNLILETRDTARGLIVNMSDVLFDTGKSTLRPGAREKLAKVSGVILGHPGLKLEVEGHTDNVGGEEYNQRLSEQRAAAVRDYLVKENIPAASVTVKGFGKTQPVVSNATAAGRQRNRRVELVVSGEIIGTQIESARAH